MRGRKNIFLIFELSLIYTLGLGIVKINFPSALDFSKVQITSEKLRISFL